MTYQEFLQNKQIKIPLRGIEKIPKLGKHLFQFQRDCVEFGLRAGSWACFLSTGLGKTLIELEWCKHAIKETQSGMALILTPLAVARQIEAEGKRFGYDVRVIREQDEARPGINICNYDRLNKLDTQSFGVVALDESSVMKNMTGKTTQLLIQTFKDHLWRMCATATPAPNDHTELGNHSEFLDVLPMSDMLMRFFIHDSADTKIWRLKGHAQNAFWDWMSSWSRMAVHPRDMGDDQPGFDLPELRTHRIHVEDAMPESYGSLFAEMVSATEMHRLKRNSAEARAAAIAAMIKSNSDSWLIWCDTDYEADALNKSLSADDVVEVRGSHSVEKKEEGLWNFASGKCRVLISKPSIAGFGMNFQHCHKMAFVGRSFSFESYFQAVRRCWRFGQKNSVDVYLIVTDAEEAINRVLERKADDHERMNVAMAEAMQRAMGRSEKKNISYNPTHKGSLPRWLVEDVCTKISCA